ncbi:hypothetical protein M9458_048957, partial [Cirrhinus mrigala]
LQCDRKLQSGRCDRWSPSAGGREPPEPRPEERQHLQVHHPQHHQVQPQLHPSGGLKP